MKPAAMFVAVMLVGGSATVAGQGLLSAGDLLEYARTDWVRPVFRIEAVESGVELGGRGGCHRVRTSFNPEAPARVGITCPAGDTLLVWRRAGGST
ncbi:MAG TPA: hypothetical protein PLL69_05410 [Gemmatimonadales bacterium]|nr:hypothetical protein [Gemmatimonadales bacterium]